MAAKSAAVILITMVLAGVVLSMRQERTMRANAMVKLHTRIRASQEALWMLQLDINRLLEPRRLREAIERSQLDLVPMIRQRSGTDLALAQLQDRLYELP